MGKLVCMSIVVAALAALFGERVVNLRKRTFATRQLVQNHLPNCVELKNLDYGSEDITILGNGLAFISTGLKYPGLPSQDVTAKLFIVDMKDSRKKPVELRMPRNFDLESFNPHGISLYTDPSENVDKPVVIPCSDNLSGYNVSSTGAAKLVTVSRVYDAVYLFVVNHPQHKSQVELFRFAEEDFSLLHLKTITHELLHSVNDIVAVGVDAFYATNDHYFSNHLLKAFVETILAQPWSNVVYYSPEEVKVVSEGYYFPNGINLSPDKKHVYVVDLFDHNVHVLERREDNGLVSMKSVPVGSLCDNVEVDPETGDLWLGCHPNAWKAFMLDPNDPPGSEVIRIQNIHSDQPVVTQVYADDGQVIVGSSVATTYEGKLLIGTVFHKALCCDLK